MQCLCHERERGYMIILLISVTISPYKAKQSLLVQGGGRANFCCRNSCFLHSVHSECAAISYCHQTTFTLIDKNKNMSVYLIIFYVSSKSYISLFFIKTIHKLFSSWVRIRKLTDEQKKSPWSLHFWTK